MDQPGTKKKGQHFLLSAAARSLSILDVARLSKDEAWNHFKLIRWADTDGDPVCPHCASLAVYAYKGIAKLFELSAWAMRVGCIPRVKCRA